MRRNGSAFVITLLIVIVVVALAVGIWYYESYVDLHQTWWHSIVNSSGTVIAAVPENWKTYKSDRFGFQFEYSPAASVVDEGPGDSSRSGTQPQNLEIFQVFEADHTNLEIGIYDPGMVQGDYGWPERPCGEWTFGPDDAPVSTSTISFAGLKTLHVISRTFGGSVTPIETNNYYCVNYPQNPVVLVFSEPPSPETKMILASFQFSR